MVIVQQKNVAVEQQKYSVVLNGIPQKRNHAQISSLTFVFLKYRINKVYIIYSGKFKILL